MTEIRPRSRQHREELPFEQLESKQLLAGVFFDAATGVVSIEGSAANDTAIVSYSGAVNLSVQLSGFSQRSFVRSDVLSIKFTGRGGDDFFTNTTNLPSTAYGQSGHDIFVGGSGVDIFHGGYGNDRLIGNAGNDELNGNQGNDFLQGGNGADSIFGGRGEDQIYGNAGPDLLNGGHHDDLIYGSTGSDEINGNDGDDELIGGTGHDIIIGADGNDQIWGNLGFDFINAGADDDRAFGGSGDDQIFGGLGNDKLHGGAGNDQVSSIQGQNEIFGDNGSDFLIGGSGLDKIYGGLHGDVIKGMESDDELFGQDGNDTIYGGDGNDFITGNNDDDKLFGEQGDDFLTGGKGDDELKGGPGHDRLMGRTGADLLFGGDGNDHLDGGEHNDWLYGNAGKDTLIAGTGVDHLFGNTGDDTLTANGPFDQLDGGAGDDTLLGLPPDFEDLTPLDQTRIANGWSSSAYVDGRRNIWITTKRINGETEFKFQLGPAGVISQFRDAGTDANLLAPSYENESTDRVVQWTWWGGWNGVKHDHPRLPPYEDRFNITQAGTNSNKLSRTFDVEWDPENGQVDVWSEASDQWKWEQDRYMQGSFSMLTRTKAIGQGAILIRRVLRVGKVTLEDIETSFSDPYIEAWTPFADSQFDRVALDINGLGIPTQSYENGVDIPDYEQTPVIDTQGWAVVYDSSQLNNGTAVGVVYGKKNPCTYLKGVCSTKGQSVLNLFDFDGGLSVLPAIKPGAIPEGTVIDSTIMLVPMRGINSQTRIRLDGLAAKIPAPRIFFPDTNTDLEITAIRNRLRNQIGTSSLRTSRLGTFL